jgi:hypothetical protein
MARAQRKRLGAMMEDGIKIRKGMCKDDLSTKIGGEVQVIETALKYKRISRARAGYKSTAIAKKE